MRCDRCGMPIRPGEKFDTHEIDQPTGTGATVRLHAELCKRPRTTQGAPPPVVRRGRRIRK